MERENLGRDILGEFAPLFASINDDFFSIKF